MRAEVRVLAVAALLVAVTPIASAAPGPSDQPKPGELITVGGTGENGCSGDGGRALDATINHGASISVDDDGTVYIADTACDNLRAVGPDGVIDKVKGPKAAASAPSKDGVLYVAGQVSSHRRDADGNLRQVAAGKDMGVLSDVAVDSNGNVYVADRYDSRIFRIGVDGSFTTLAGKGSRHNTKVDSPSHIAVDSKGNVYVSRVGEGSAVYKIDSAGKVTPVTSTATGYSGDCGPAAQARLGKFVGGIAVDADDNLYIADYHNGLVRKVDRSGVITSLRHAVGFADDVAIGPDGAVYVAGGAKVQRLAHTGDEGTPAPPPVTDGAGSKSPYAKLDAGTVQRIAAGVRPLSLDVDAAGNVYFANGAGVVVVRPDGRHEAVRFDHGQDPEDVRPQAVAVTSDGSLYVDTDRQVYRIYPDGTAVVVAGGSRSEAPAEGQIAVALTTAQLAAAHDNDVYVKAGGRVHRLEDDGTLGPGFDVDEYGSTYAVDDRGSLYVADRDAGKIYRTTPDGKNTTIAGTGDLIDFENPEGAPNRQATETAVGKPRSVAVADDGTAYIADSSDIIRVDPDGTINTILADARATTLALDGHGNLYFGDEIKNEIKVLVRPGELEFSDPFPWVWVIVGGALVLLAGAVVVFARRRRKS